MEEEKGGHGYEGWMDRIAVDYQFIIHCHVAGDLSGEGDEVDRVGVEVSGNGHLDVHIDGTLAGFIHLRVDDMALTNEMSTNEVEGKQCVLLILSDGCTHASQ